MDKTYLDTTRHSCAHLMASAITELYPKAKFGVGPVVENGFYYDVFVQPRLTEEDLPKIEAKMREYQKAKLPFIQLKKPIDQAIELFEKREQTFKVELLNSLKEKGTTRLQTEDADLPKSADEEISLYQTGEHFIDLCRGPHVESADKIGAFKLHNIAGAYWRGDAHNPQLQRIYGWCFETAAELKKLEEQMEEAKKRDHRKLGKELKLFTFSDLVGPGLPLWLPHGTILADELENLAKETEFQAGFQRVRTPHIAKEEMYKISGHLPYYADLMFPPMVMDEDGHKTTYYLKGMNCPHHHQIYASEPRSYRDLPVRLAEYGTCYRYEQSGELFGLMRVRSMQMNDAHIYCTEEQFNAEFLAVIEMYLKYFKIFGVEKYLMRFSTHAKSGLGKKYINNENLWLKTEKMVRDILVKEKIPYEEIADEAAFYGPKIDVQIWSAIGREFTLATNQVDFAVPARFGLLYKDSDGTEKTPLCIHRAPLGTHERFISFLIEHYAGAFPLWLAPTQIAFIPVGEKFVDATNKFAADFKNKNIRTEVMSGSSTVGANIREAASQKIPYLIVVGEKEASGDDWAVKVRGTEDLLKISAEKFLEKILEEIISRQE